MVRPPITRRCLPPAAPAKIQPFNCTLRPSLAVAVQTRNLTLRIAHHVVAVEVLLFLVDDFGGVNHANLVVQAGELLLSLLLLEVFLLPFQALLVLLCFIFPYVVFYNFIHF